jgi:hypothetical protein
MSTQNQIDANRRNAQKSTGPRSVEGKANSRFNALKTGIHAQSLLLPSENAQDLDLLIAEYYEEYRPATPQDRCLVDGLIRDEWLLRRLYVADTQLTVLKMNEAFRPSKDLPIGQAFSLGSNYFARLHRIIEVTHRRVQRAQTELAARPASPDPDPPSGPADSEPLTSELASFSQMIVEPPNPGQIPLPSLPADPSPKQLSAYPKDTFSHLNVCASVERYKPDLRPATEA